MFLNFTLQWRLQYINSDVHRDDKAGSQQLAKNNQKESWLSPKLRDLWEDNSINEITVKTEKEVSH